MMDEHDPRLQRIFDERLLRVLPPPRAPRRRSAARFVGASLAVLLTAGGFAFAADAVQDAFEDALRERGAVVKPEGWLFVVACRAWKRYRWRHRLFRPLAALRGLGHVTSREDEIDLFVELAKLTERQREVIVSRYVLGLSQAETAEALDIAPGTVAATTHQATSLLRERLLGGTK